MIRRIFHPPGLGSSISISQLPVERSLAAGFRHLQYIKLSPLIVENKHPTQFFVTGAVYDGTPFRFIACVAELLRCNATKTFTRADQRIPVFYLFSGGTLSDISLSERSELFNCLVLVVLLVLAFRCRFHALLHRTGTKLH